jgi:hypothetical protein
LSLQVFDEKSHLIAFDIMHPQTTTSEHFQKLRSSTGSPPCYNKCQRAISHTNIAIWQALNAVWRSKLKPWEKITHYPLTKISQHEGT